MYLKPQEDAFEKPLFRTFLYVTNVTASSCPDMRRTDAKKSVFQLINVAAVSRDLTRSLQLYLTMLLAVKNVVCLWSEVEAGHLAGRSQQHRVIVSWTGLQDAS